MNIEVDEGGERDELQFIEKKNKVLQYSLTQVPVYRGV